jgi:hypothetical protein
VCVPPFKVVALFAVTSILVSNWTSIPLSCCLYMFHHVHVIFFVAFYLLKILRKHKYISKWRIPLLICFSQTLLESVIKVWLYLPDVVFVTTYVGFDLQILEAPSCWCCYVPLKCTLHSWKGMTFCTVGWLAAVLWKLFSCFQASSLFLFPGFSVVSI